MVFTTGGLNAGERVVRSKINRPIEGMLLQALGEEKVDPPQAAASETVKVNP